MIMDPNVFISDTVSSVYSIGHTQGLINKMKPAKEDSTTLPDVTETETGIISDLRVAVSGNQGNMFTKFMLSKMRYSPRNKFNLFSVKKQLMDR